MVFNGDLMVVQYIYIYIPCGRYRYIYMSKLGTLTTRRIVKRSVTGAHVSPQFVRLSIFISGTNPTYEQVIP